MSKAQNVKENILVIYWWHDEIEEPVKGNIKRAKKDDTNCFGQNK